MTNANVDVVVSTNNAKEVTLRYKGGRQKISVPVVVPIITFNPADNSILISGAHVFTVTQTDVEGRLTALRILVEKDGTRPRL